MTNEEIDFRCEMLVAWLRGYGKTNDADMLLALKARAEAAEKLVAQWEHDIKFWGIVEIAVRNVSVMDYMKHWEARAEAAEKRVIELEARLTSSADRG